MYPWVNLTYLKRPEFYILDLFLSNTPVSQQKKKFKLELRDDRTKNLSTEPKKIGTSTKTNQM